MNFLSNFLSGGFLADPQKFTKDSKQKSGYVNEIAQFQSNRSVYRLDYEYMLAVYSVELRMHTFHQHHDHD